MSQFNPEESVYVIAEIGINHNGDLQVAKELIDEAVRAGVDAVKFQVRSLEDIYTQRVLNDPLKAEHGTQYLLNEIKRSFLGFDDIAGLHEYTMSRHGDNVDFFATPFDIRSAHFLNELGLEIFKVGSPDLSNLPLLKVLSSFRKHIILSTGMSNEDEIVFVSDFLKKSDARFHMLHCNSTYPASTQDINLNYIKTLERITGTYVGYSGHERGYSPSLGAVALGARIIERHITMDRNHSGPDHRSSLEPTQFSMMINAIRELEKALGNGVKNMNQGEANNRLSLGKSLVYASGIAKGTIISSEHLVAKTPAKGVSPLKFDEYVGRRIEKDVAKDDYLSPTDFELAGEAQEKFDIPRTWGIVGRLNDFEEFLHLKPDIVEVHLTWRDLQEFNLERLGLVGKTFKQDLVVHAPEYFRDKLIDFATPEKEILDLSLEMLNRTFELTRTLANHFEGVDPALGPRVVVHPGGHFKVHTDSDKSEQYACLRKNFELSDSRDLRVLVENMPPFPWYFGGQWHNTIFMDPKEIAQFAEQMKWGVCYDLSHALLYCNHKRKSLAEFTRTINDHISYLHVSDAAGTTQEGLQLGEGVIDFEHLFEILSKLNVGFVPEIWQGHLDKGHGFKKALRTIEGLMRKVSGESCSSHPPGQHVDCEFASVNALH